VALTIKRVFPYILLRSAGSALARIGGKQAFGTTAAFSLVTAACRPLISPPTPVTPLAPQRTFSETAAVTEVAARTATLTRTPTPTLTETPEPTSTPEGYVSPERMQELAASFVCNTGGTGDVGCVRDVYRYPNWVDFDFISSGVFQEIDLANPKSGERLGRGMVLRAVSKDRNDRPFVVSILIQLEPVDRPGYNYLYGAAWTLIVAGSQQMGFVGEETLSADEWSRFIPEGATYEIALLKRRAPSSDRISSDPVTRDLYYPYYDDSNYLEMLRAFYESSGEEVDENLFLFVSGSSDNTPRKVTIP